MRVQPPPTLPVVLLLTSVTVWFAWAFFERPRLTPTRVLVPSGEALHVLQASDPATRAAGLRGHATMPADGLLLIWPAAGAHPIWMHEMQFPIDAIWGTRDGAILAIAAHLAPCTTTDGCPLVGTDVTNATFVLELVAGTADARALQVGQRLMFATDETRHGRVLLRATRTTP